MRSSFERPAELWAGPANALRQMSRSNAGAVRLYGKAVSLQWQQRRVHVPGLAHLPPRVRSEANVSDGDDRPWRTIGGNACRRFGSRNLSALASQGYFVFMPNPRGSFGQGEAFTRANVKDFGYGDWRDDLAGIDAAVAAAPIDSTRLGPRWLELWRLHERCGGRRRRRASKRSLPAPAIVNWQSYYGQNKIDQWMIPFFGASVYDDPQVYARSSPITFITRSQTPVLILQGERDEEVPAPQAFEFWHAMKTLGVPAKLVVYADEGHAPQKVANQIDILSQTVGWFDRYLKL